MEETLDGQFSTLKFMSCATNGVIWLYLLSHKKTKPEFRGSKIGHERLGSSLLMSNMGVEQQFAANLSNFYIQSRASMSIWWPSHYVTNGFPRVSQRHKKYWGLRRCTLFYFYSWAFFVECTIPGPACGRVPCLCLMLGRINNPSTGEAGSSARR